MAALRQMLCSKQGQHQHHGFDVMSEYRGDASIMTLMLDKVKVDPNAQHGREMHAALHVAAKAGESSATLPASTATKD